MKTKKVTFGKSLENLTKYQFDFLQKIKGGIAGIPVEVHYPTRVGPACLDGYVWSNALNRCVRIGEAVALHGIRTNQ